MDADAQEHGRLDAAGRPRGFVRLYVSMLNAERLALGRLEGDDAVEARRPRGSRHGAPIIVPFVVGYSVSLDYGGYLWQVEVDGVVRARGRSK